PQTILVNPELEPLSGETEEGWEGCLSVPGLRGVVARHKQLRYRGFDLEGRPLERVATGFHARVVQHECDHRILYPMRIRDFARFGFTEVLFPELAGQPDD
ncbi:MAG: peptide deformylase, partial [Burkholderiaceae bacterium]|nr:peptide deformylase [Burkholderiaceae bacterium]